MTGESWAYRCSKCGKLVDVDDVASHYNAHRQEPDWTGQLSLTREDKPPEPSP